MDKYSKAAVAFMLALNIAVGIGIITYVLRSDKGYGLISDKRLKDVNNLEDEVDRLYTELLRKMPDKNNYKVNNEGTKEIPMFVLSQLKPIAIHMELNITDLGKGDTHKLTAARGWATQPMVGPERQVLYDGMQHENGSIIVPAAGVYVVYSHVTFNTEENRHDDEETDFHHLIVRYSAAKLEENIALQHVISESRNRLVDGASLVFSSDIHGILELNAGDQLRVDISATTQLNNDKHGHFFGLYMI